MLACEINKPLTNFTVRQHIQETDWPPVFRDHDVVRGAGPGELVVPLAIYVDSAQYGGSAGAGRTRSVVNVSIVNLCTQRRHVGIVFRKQVHCRCGCKGHCSYSRFYTFLAWSLKALADGTYPSLDWDGREFATTEQERINLS
eukprot:9497824-Pyramimonas_sp.AAC.1